MVKRVDGNLWEPRPLSHRVLFFYWRDSAFVLSRHFVKKTRKAPPREIGRARDNLEDSLARRED
ncbi:MAG: type II toxin-antitoxin system RelE/ParE family toxin [Deltaproteobacteria bacterium]|nr:type II toxin-antitoxin system RelE/ParE family toxin [Deltaproteobacteria bacterium]